MNELKDATMIICTSMIALSYISILVPSEKSNKMINFFIKIFFLTMMLTPIINFVSYSVSEEFSQDVSMEAIEENNVNALVESGINKQIEEVMTGQINSVLSDKKIETEKTEIKFEYDNNNKILVKEIKIYTEKKYQNSNIENIVGELFETEIIIIYTD